MAERQFLLTPGALLAVETSRSAARERGKDFLNQVKLFRARTDLSIASFLIKVGLGETENLWRVLVEAETAMAQFESTR